MSKVAWTVLLSVTFLLVLSTANNGCGKLSSGYFTWLNADGSLVLPKEISKLTDVSEAEDSCCGASCKAPWSPLQHLPNCRFCASKSSVICKGTNVNSLPDFSSLRTPNLTLFKMTDVSLISLPPKSFSGLSINRLIIEYSDLSYIATDIFTGIKMIKYISLVNDSLNYLSQADVIFGGLKDLTALKLENNGLRVLSSTKSAGLKKLKYLSLAGNPIYTLDVFFLENSSLTFLDLRGITFRVKQTDLQSSGLNLLPNTLNFLDLSRADITVEDIKMILTSLTTKNITTLNLSYLKTSQVTAFTVLPALFPIKDSLQFLSVEGTDLSKLFPLRNISMLYGFEVLEELNMRNCSLNDLGTGIVFNVFPNLKVLSLSMNKIFNLKTSIFSNLPSLQYMDLSSNQIKEIDADFNAIALNLQVLDLSNVNFDDTEEEDMFSMFNTVQNVQRLSLCGATISGKQVQALTSLSKIGFLDLSNTMPNSPSLESGYNAIFGTMNHSLTELIFTGNNFDFSISYPNFFSSLSSLKTLNLTYNLVRTVTENSFGVSLETLHLSQNLITTWYTPFINSNESELKYLDLSSNQITFVSEAMLTDIDKLKYLNLVSNPIICHNKVVAMVCENVKNQPHKVTMVNWQHYRCYDVFANSYRFFPKAVDCDQYYAEASTAKPDVSSSADDINHGVKVNSVQLFTIFVPVVFVSVISCIVYVKYWDIRLFIHRFFSLRKARLLGRKMSPTNKPEVQYDAFVSYSDIDRSWVLDHLIPNMEKDGDVCLCFHERDFQVGLSILENIIESMDRSRAHLLVVSSAFIHSKWCQFEMHLAQYRLIETLTDRLVLVMLEDVPRKARPQTLHHLMLTKTYLVWPHQPCKEDAYETFWKRLKKALKPNVFHV